MKEATSLYADAAKAYSGKEPRRGANLGGEGDGDAASGVGGEEAAPAAAATAAAAAVAAAAAADGDRPFNPLGFLGVEASLQRQVQNLHSSLASLKSSEAAYRLCCSFDAAAVAACRSEEAKALAELEELEGERLRGFGEALERLVETEQVSWEEGTGKGKQKRRPIGVHPNWVPNGALNRVPTGVPIATLEYVATIIPSSSLFPSLTLTLSSLLFSGLPR